MAEPYTDPVDGRVMDVTAVLVTRGDVALDEILASWEGVFAETIIWTNGARFNCRGDDGFYTDRAPDLMVYGRWEAVKLALNPVVFVQDDDCVLRDPRKLVERYEPGRVVTNVPYSFRRPGVDSMLLGFGAVMDRDLPERCFQQLVGVAPAGFREHPSFLRQCDVAVLALADVTVTHTPVMLLDASYAPNRLWRELGHRQQRDEVLGWAEAAKALVLA